MTDEINIITQTEERMYDLHQKIVSAVTPEEKKALRIRLKTLEKKYNATMEQDINGKTYPTRLYYSDNKPMDKQEILKLIDSVDTPEDKWYNDEYNISELDESGVSVGKNRFEYVDKGW